MNYGEPSHDETMSPQREAQRTYLLAYLDSFAAALNSAHWTNAATGYAPYIDARSWIDFHLVNIIAVSGKVPGNSTFFHKPRQGPIMFGPIWDFDKAFSWTEARDDAPYSWDPGRGAFGAVWWGRLFQNPNFWQAYIDRFQELNAGPFGIPGLCALIDRLNQEVKESAVRDMVRWKQPKRGGSQESEIAYFKEWLARRIRFMETNFFGSTRHPGTRGTSRLGSPSGHCRPTWSDRLLHVGWHRSPGPFTDIATGAAWLLRGVVDFDFPREFVLDVNQSALLVPFDPEKEPARLKAWRQKWGFRVRAKINSGFAGGIMTLWRGTNEEHTLPVCHE